MPRKEKDWVVERDGRDKGKVFHIKEMDAWAAEKWAMRAFLAMAHAGAPVPDNIFGAGMAGIAFMGIQSLWGLQWPEIEPLFDELMTCVEIIPDPANRTTKRPLIKDDVEEVETLIMLRLEAFQLHVNFSLADALSRPTSSPAPTSSTVSSTTSTSPAPSVP